MEVAPRYTLFTRLALLTLLTLFTLFLLLKLFYTAKTLVCMLTYIQGCTNRCSLAAGLRGNEERMRK